MSFSTLLHLFQPTNSGKEKQLPESWQFVCKRVMKRCLSVLNATSGLYVSKEGKKYRCFSVTFTPCLSLKALKDCSSKAGLDKFCCSGPQKPKKPVHKKCNRKVVCICIERLYVFVY